jgi:ketosteroid isomerase-like protein
MAHDRQGKLMTTHAPTPTPNASRAVRTGAAYSNRYVSVLTITERKVTRWRDYLDPIAVFDAAGWPASPP